MRFMKRIALIALCATSLAIDVHLSNNAIVEGSEYKFAGKSIQQFLGIPFGTRTDRMTNMIPYDLPPKTRFEAKFNKRICPQTSPFEISDQLGIFKKVIGDATGGDEHYDCTLMDIFRPAGATKDSNLDVIVYIHGGAFSFGSRHFPLNRGTNFHRLADAQNSILVIPEYSLGPYGFYYDPDNGVANAAILEVYEALRWIQKFIADFGGNPNKVTLMGHSAGASLAQLVHFYLHDKGEQLFTKLILMSGTALLFAPIAPEDAIARQNKLLEALGCNAGDIKCLQSKSDKEITLITDRDGGIWGPVIDGKVIQGDIEYYLPSDPTRENPGHFLRDVEVMLTATKDDGNLFCLRHMESIFDKRHKIFDDFGHGHLIEDVESHYLQGSCPFTTTGQILTGGVFFRPLQQSENAYLAAGLPVRVVVYDITLELPKSDTWTYKALTAMQKLVPGSEKYPLEMASNIMKMLGSFHMVEQPFIFSPTLLSAEELQNLVGSWTYTAMKTAGLAEVNLSWFPNFSEMEKKVVDPLFAFIAGSGCQGDSCRLTVCPVSEKMCIVTIMKHAYTPGKPSGIGEKRKHEEAEEEVQEEPAELKPPQPKKSRIMSFFSSGN